jgi:hypothetical protein
MRAIDSVVTLFAVAFALLHASTSVAAGGVVGTGTAGSCTEAAFDTVFFKAQASGGGIITFNCGAAPHAIVFGAYKPVSTTTEIRGGGLITLSGGNVAGLFQVFTAGALTLGNIVITRGYGAYGAIENLGSLAVNDSRLESNTSAISGGAIVNHANATLTNVIVTGNAAAQFGGGVYSDGGTLKIAGSRFANNTATLRGGGLEIAMGASATITDSTFAQNNGGGYGGGVSMVNGTATFLRSVVISNWAVAGGGIYQEKGSLTLTQVIVAGNGSDNTGTVVAESGGGLLLGLAPLGIITGTTVLTGVSIAGNRAANGGGITANNGTTTLTNVTLSVNQAALNGGAVDVIGGNVTLTNVTITDNSASNTGGVLSRRGGTLTVKNTALANPGSPNCYAALPGVTFNLSSDGTCAFGGGRDNVAMAFDPLRFNGGFTLTVMPLPGNPVIDNGTGIGCPGTDQRGVARPSGLACDVGAVEYVAGAPAIGTAIEYYNAGFGHYFITQLRDEILQLDAGIFVGWTRTDQQFNVYPDATAGLAAVCRFFTVAFPPTSSHFYAPRGFGCEGTLQNKDWQLEGDVFYTPLPNASGACPAGHLPVYRLYNNGQGGAPNHRFTTSATIRTQMIASGYVAEGAGIGVGMCSPQ